MARKSSARDIDRTELGLSPGTLDRPATLKQPPRFGLQIRLGLLPPFGPSAARDTPDWNLEPRRGGTRQTDARPWQETGRFDLPTAEPCTHSAWDQSSLLRHHPPIDPVARITAVVTATVASNSNSMPVRSADHGRLSAAQRDGWRQPIWLQCMRYLSTRAVAAAPNGR